MAFFTAAEERLQGEYKKYLEISEKKYLILQKRYDKMQRSVKRMVLCRSRHKDAAAFPAA